MNRDSIRKILEDYEEAIIAKASCAACGESDTGNYLELLDARDAVISLLEKIEDYNDA